MDSEVDSIILWPNVDDEDQDALWSHISKRIVIDTSPNTKDTTDRDW